MQTDPCGLFATTSGAVRDAVLTGLDSGAAERIRDACTVFAVDCSVPAAWSMTVEGELIAKRGEGDQASDLERRWFAQARMVLKRCIGELALTEREWVLRQLSGDKHGDGGVHLRVAVELRAMAWRLQVVVVLKRGQQTVRIADVHGLLDEVKQVA